MKFDVSTREFNDVLKMVGTTGADSINVTAKDLNVLEIFANGEFTSIHIDMTAGAVMEPGSAWLNARFINDIVRKASDPIIHIYSCEGNGVIQIKCGKSKFKLNTESKTLPESMPTELEQYSIDANLLSDLLDRVSYAVAIRTTRPVLTGVNLSCEGSVLQAVATDSYRLAKAEVNGKFGNFNITIPGKTISALQTLLENCEKDSQITISTNEKQAYFSNGDVTMGTRLLDERYPDVARLIPTSFESSITVSRDAFQDVLERAMFLKSKEDGAAVIHLMFSEKEGIKVSSDSQEIGSFEEDLEGTVDCTAPFSIFFSTGYLVDALKHIRKETVTVRFTGELKPFVIEDDEVVHLMLPIRRH